MSGKQLAWIGAVAMAYNEAEEWLKTAFSNCLGFPWVGNDIVARLGVGQLPPILLNAIGKLDLPPETLKMAEYSLVGEGFTQLKSYRDGVVHAQLIDESRQIGYLPNKGHADYILLSIDALRGLYERLALVKKELQALTTIVSFKPKLMFGLTAGGPHKEQLEESIQVATAQLLRHQTQRRRLKPLPTLPKESQSFALAPHNEAPRRGRKKKDD